MAFVSDNAFEIELNKVLALAETIKRDQTALMSNYKNLPQKDKVLAIQKITGNIKTIQHFLDKSKQQDVFNSGIKFKLENLKNKLVVLQTLWKKIEASDS